MFALHQPRPRWVASQESTQDVNSGSPKSPGISRVSPLASGQVMTIVRATYSRNADPTARSLGSSRSVFTRHRDYSDSMSLRMFAFAVVLTAVCPRLPAAAQAPARPIGGILDT